MVLRQLSSDTADSLTKVIDDTLKRPHIGVLLGIPQTRMEPPDPAFIAPILSEALTESPFIDEFYIWSTMSGKYPFRALAGLRSQERHARDQRVRERFRKDPEVEDRLLPALSGYPRCAGRSSPSPTICTAAGITSSRSCDGPPPPATSSLAWSPSRWTPDG